MPRGRKAALQTTRIKRTRPRPVRTVITKGNLVELFDSLMDGDESIQQSYNFSVCVDTPSRKQARGLDAIFEEELSQDETGDISNASQHSVKKNQYMTQLQELNDQYDDESDFSLLIESENGIRMQIINGKLKPHPRQTKSRTPEKVEPFKQLDQNRPMPPPKVKKNETKQEMQAIPPTPIPESALRARLRQSLAFPDRMAITKRQIRETHEARMSARPSIAPRMGPFSIRDIIDKRLQLADEFGKAPITPPQRQTLSPQPMRPSMASLKEDDLSNILTAKRLDLTPSTLISPMIVTRKPMLSLSYLNESSFNPPLASTPITDRKKPTSLQFVDSLTMSTKTPSTASSATPASPAPQVAKRRRTSSGDGKSVRIQEKTPEQKDDDVEMAEEEVNETNGTSVEDNLANLLETSVHLTEATINTNKDNHLKTAEEITLPIREPSLVEAVNDEKEPISDETQRKSEDFTIGVAHTFGQTLNANATEDIDNFTFGPEPPKVAQTLTDNVTLGQNNLSQILLGVGDQFSIQTLPQDATGIASVNVTQATATRKNATQMLYESLLDDRPFFLADFVGDENDSLAKLLHIIEQAKVDEWREVLPNDTFNNIKKLGEGVYGEVFATTWNGAPTAIKIIPFRADNVIDEAKVNGEFLKFAADIIPEVLITRELSGLSNTGSYQTSNFIELLQARVVKGNYPEEFLEAWDVFAGRKGGSENDRPDTYSTDERLYIVIALSMGGIDIEHYTPRNENEVFSLLLQISFALMAAERELCFEHRDLHVGNVLVKQTEDEYIEYRMNGLPLRIRSHGVKANIIDFTNSRLSKAGVNIYLDLEEDQELFQGQGHYQFDIYRMMQAHNGGNWCDFNPKSNVFWIHYMSKELISRVAKKRITPKRKKQLEAIFDKVLMFDELSAFVYDEVMNDVCEKYLVE